LDATNIVDADVAVVTSIALDHTDWLGPDRKALAARRPVFSVPVNRPSSVSRICRTPSLRWREKGARSCAATLTGAMTPASNVVLPRRGGTLADLPLPQVPLPNAATALAALRASGLQVSDQAIRDGIKRAMLPGVFR
jgi:dihydrofolate synthase/folylpolyglutamate synthase